MKKAIGILVNDIHLNKDNGALVESIFDQLVVLCKKKKCKSIYCGGDVFTNRSGQPLSCLIVWNNIISQLKKEGIELHVIPGNHDKTNPDAEESYLDVFSSANLYLYKRWTVLVDDVLIAMIPYFSEQKWLESYEEVVNLITTERMPKHSAKILISHIGFDGVKNNDGSIVESKIKPSMFKMWDKVLLGHYHNASKLGNNVYYTGSAYQNNFGENITDKGFTVMYADGDIEFVPSVFPKYIKETVEANDKKTLRNLLEKYEGDEENFIRFCFVGKKVDFQNINVAEIESRGIDVKFTNDETTDAMNIAASDEIVCYDKNTIKKDFISFCKENNISGKKMTFGFNLIKNL